MKANLANKLTLKYTYIQVLHSLANCILNGYAAVFLKYKGFTNTQIGFVFSSASILIIVLQPMIASYIDKTDKFTLRQITMALMNLSILVGIGMFLGNNSYHIVLVTFTILNFIQGLLGSLINSLAVEYINKGVLINYGLSRGTGSLMFAIFSSILGYIIAIYNPNIIIVIFLFLYGLLFLSTYCFKLKPYYEKYLRPTVKDQIERKNKKSPSRTSVFSFFVEYKRYTLLLFGIIMLYYSHIMINTYLINIIESVGGGSKNLGIALSIAAALELPVMAVFVLLLKRIKCSTLIKVSAIFFFLKSLTTWLAPSVGMIYFSQTLQIFAFAIFTPAIVFYVNMVIHEKDSVKGQSMIGVATFGVAGTIANITGGKIQDLLGVSDMLLIGTIVAAIGMLIVLFVVEDTPLIGSKR